MPPSGLGFAAHDVCVHRHETAPDHKSAGFQIDVLPEKSECLASTKTGECQREPEGMQSVVGNACEERLQIRNLPGLGGCEFTIKCSGRGRLSRGPCRSCGARRRGG